MFVQAPVPVAQRRRVVLPETLDVLDLEARPFESQLDPRERQGLPVGEDVARGEEVLVGVVLRVERGDRVVEERPSGPKQLEERGCVEVDLVLADVLGHADARDRVKGTLRQEPVIREADLDPVGDAGGGDLLAGQLGLGRRDRRADDLRAVLAGGVDRKTPPAAPDVQDLHPRLEPELRGDELQLGPLRLGERLGAPGEDGAAVGHRLVEEQGEEVVADVVVVADGLGVALDAVEFPAQEQLEARPVRQPARRRRKHERQAQAQLVDLRERRGLPGVDDEKGAVEVIDGEEPLGVCPSEAQ